MIEIELGDLRPGFGRRADLSQRRRVRFAFIMVYEVLRFGFVSLAGLEWVPPLPVSLVLQRRRGKFADWRE
jgi:hypothetical protein